MISIKIIKNTLTPYLAEVTKRLTNPSDILMVIGRDWRASIDANFASGGRPVRWRPSIRAVQTGGQTLIKTGTLRNSFTSTLLGTRSVAIGSDVRYAHAHHAGSVVGRGVKLPVRPIIVLHDADVEQTKSRIEHFIADGRLG